MEVQMGEAELSHLDNSTSNKSEETHSFTISAPNDLPNNILKYTIRTMNHFV